MTNILVHEIDGQQIPCGGPDIKKRKNPEKLTFKKINRKGKEGKPTKFTPS